MAVRLVLVGENKRLTKIRIPDLAPSSILPPKLPAREEPLLASMPSAGSGVFEEKGGDDEFGEPERHHPFPKGNFHAKILS
jgi:hypothetical protein